ncbi:MAG: UPF0280 family protein [Rubrimonas sp.]|uniref:UPF0280 family protein n=1 Tax=Rubrimonas sp. TaxID=2036015 RepID=UPI002FDCC0EA
MSGPTAARLADGRLHLQHGPIDLIVAAEGPAAETALHAARARFATILSELVAELPRLRSPDGPAPSGAVARRMVAAVAPHAAAEFVTPMAAVAGAVADEVLATMRATGPLRRAYVNNGGDIALHLSGDARFTVALAQEDGRVDGALTLDAESGAGGVATSGQGGRSLSLGIADAVTVLAGSAAAADAAATLIANAVDLPGHPAIRRIPANILRDDSDLGARLAVASVGPLAQAETEAALARGAARAEAMLRVGLILGAALRLRGAARLVGAARVREVAHA